MSEVFDWSFRRVVEVSASSAPTPGGGSVSAMVGSLGAAMVSMVANLTVGKEKYRDVEPQVRDILAATNEILGRLEQLVDQDIQEFSRFMAVLSLPKNTDEEKARREELRQAALKSASEAPLTIARTCLEALKLAETLADIGNKGAISDVGVAAYVVEAALNSALLSVDINLPMITDQDYRRTVSLERRRLQEEARDRCQRAVARVQERL